MFNLDYPDNLDNPEYLKRCISVNNLQLFADTMTMDFHCYPYKKDRLSSDTLVVLSILGSDIELYQTSVNHRTMGINIYISKNCVKLEIDEWFHLGDIQYPLIQFVKNKEKYLKFLLLFTYNTLKINYKRLMKVLYCWYKNDVEFLKIVATRYGFLYSEFRFLLIGVPRQYVRYDLTGYDKYCINLIPIMEEIFIPPIANIIINYLKIE